MSPVLYILAVIGLVILVAVLSYVFGKFAAAGFIRQLKRNSVKPTQTTKSNEQKE